MRAQLKVTEIATNAVLVNVSGTQNGVLSHPQFKALANNNELDPAQYKIELYRSTTNSWVRCKVTRHRDRTYRGLQVIPTPVAEVTIREVPHIPTSADDVPAHERGFPDLTGKYRPRIEAVLQQWDTGSENPATVGEAIQILRELKDAYITKFH